MLLEQQDWGLREPNVSLLVIKTAGIWFLIRSQCSRQTRIVMSQSIPMLPQVSWGTALVIHAIIRSPINSPVKV